MTPEPVKKFPSKLDIALIGGLTCGVLGLCALAAGFLFVWRFPPSAQSEPTPVGVFASPTVSVSNPDLAFLTPTALLSEIATSTLETAFTPAPASGPIDAASLTHKLAFACFVDQLDQICIMDEDGNNRRQLTNFTSTAFYPSFAASNQTIYFSSNQTGNFEIYSVDIDGNNTKQLTSGIGSLYGPELSPDGQKILFAASGNGLWVMNTDGSDPHAITFKDDIDATWSPDGSMIAFASLRPGTRQLFVANANGKKANQVTDLSNMGGRSAWSPDGKQLAFYRGPAGDRDIYIINIDGTGLDRLTNGGDNLGPSWSADGQWIAFTSFRDGNNEIYIVHPNGRGLRRLTENFSSDWQPRWGR